MDRSASAKPTGSPLTRLLERSNSDKPAGSPQCSLENQEHISASGLDNHSDDEDDVDDFDSNFNCEQQRRWEPPGQTRQVFRSEEYRQLFHLPPEEVLIQDFNCALQKKILLQGHMYLFEHYVCFYSNIFGYEKKKVIILKDVTCVRKARTAGLFPNAIEIVAWGKKNFFASFLSRDEAFRLIVDGWARHSRYARLVSDSQSNLSQALVTSNSAEITQVRHDPSFSESSFGSRDIVEVPAEQGIEANDLEVSEVTYANNPMESESIDTKEDSASIQVSLWEIEEEDAPEVPEHYRTVLECELPVDVKEFFQLFYSNESIKFCESFHRKCGDEDFQCTEWAKHRHFGHVRDLSFRHPINFYFGPKATYCQEVQRYRVYRNSHLIVETSQQMNDIPYGDHFRVEGRWDVINLLDRDTPHCSVRISVDVSFSKKTVWKGKIEQGTFDECKEAFSTWLAEAQRTLQEKVDKCAKGRVTSQSTSTYILTASTRSMSTSSNLKRKLDRGFVRTQGHSKISKNCNSVPSSRTVMQAGRKKNEEISQTKLADSDKTSEPLQQECRIVGFTALSQMKLSLAMCAMFIILLVQTGAIIALARSSRVQYVPFGLSRGEDYFGNHVRHFGKEGDLRLVQRAQFLQEEIAIAEARLQNMQNDLNLLKVNVHLIEKIPKNSASTA